MKKLNKIETRLNHIKINAGTCNEKSGKSLYQKAERSKIRGGSKRKKTEKFTGKTKILKRKFNKTGTAQGKKLKFTGKEGT